MITDRNNWEKEDIQAALEDKIENLFKDGRPAAEYSQKMLPLLKKTDAATFGIIAEAYYYRYFLSSFGFSLEKDTTRDVLEELHRQALFFLTTPSISSASHPKASHDTALRFLIAFPKYHDDQVFFEYLQSVSTDPELEQLAFMALARSYKKNSRLDKKQLINAARKHLFQAYVGNFAGQLLLEIGNEEAIDLIRASFEKMNPGGRQVMVSRGLAKADNPTLQQAIFDMLPQYAVHTGENDVYVTIHHIYSDIDGYIATSIRNEEGYTQRRNLEKLVNLYRFYKISEQEVIFEKILFDQSIHIEARVLFCEACLKNKVLFLLLKEVILRFLAIAKNELQQPANSQISYLYGSLEALHEEQLTTYADQDKEKPGQHDQWLEEWNIE